MAFIRRLEHSPGTSSSRHTEVDATYRVVRSDGHGIVVQIDTFGSDERKLQAKVSQSIQVDRDRAKELITILEESFPGIRR